jgi:DNA excision repair protein ERCC-2
MCIREVKISVRNLIEFILRTGDIDSGYVGANRAQQGTKAHQKLQKNNEKIYDNYKKEVYLKYVINYGSLSLKIEGRADGIFKDGNKFVIEEIKSTNTNLLFIDESYNQLHWAQAKFYGYIYCKENFLTNIDIQLSYFQLSTYEVKTLKKSFTIEELEDFVLEVVRQYEKWANYKFNWIEERNASIKQLQFPFSSYRKGQRQLAVSVYNTIRNNGSIFVEAPTGIGKTISTIFPTVKAMAEGLVDCVFYLTAKTITRTVAEEGFERMKLQGLRFKNITLTAKDKICFNKEASCNGEECKYAKGYYDRVNSALYDILTKESSFSRETIEQYSTKYIICPFEFSLDLSLFCDGIICDYNYVFDPRVSLRRFFQDTVQDNYVLLVDEAHNLVDRAREMYSSKLIKSEILSVRKQLRGKAPILYKHLNSINRFLNDYKGEIQSSGESYMITKEVPKELMPVLRNFTKECDEYLIKNKGTDGYEEILELYFNINNFINIGDLYGEEYYTYFQITDRDLIIKLFCVEPKRHLEKIYLNTKGVVQFSATLNPINYYKDMLGTKENEYRIMLKSPFPQENLCLTIAPISTRFTLRDKTKGLIRSYIYEFIKSKQGNYMVFFPSYVYMKKIYEEFIEEYKDVEVLVQTGEMNEDDRELFLNNFDTVTENTKVAFCVMGGIFSEGIDLVGDKLIGAIIIGVALPQICLERNLIKQYYDEKAFDGYDYSYTYPGMAKVTQAVGRVIRTEHDRGAVLLIDDRFCSKKYFSIMPSNWSNLKLVRKIEDLKETLNKFWTD